MKPVIETLTFALRKLHHPEQHIVPGPGRGVRRELRCTHCAPFSSAWPCPTIALAGAVLRGEA